MPIDKINVGDQYQNPMFRDGVIFVVEEVSAKDRMVKVQSYSFQACKPFMKPFWKKNTDRMFSESWRIMVGSPQPEHDGKGIRKEPGEWIRKEQCEYWRIKVKR